MGRPKKIVPPPVAQSQTEIEESELELESASLSARAAASLKPEYIRMLKKIAYYTAKVGLPLQESCLLVDYDFEKFTEDMKLNPIIGTVIKAKETEYKKDLLYTLSQRARSGDDKLAQWLLERKYPEEYGEKKPRKPGDNDAADLIAEAFRFIRNSGDGIPLISPTHATTHQATVLELDGKRTIVQVAEQTAEEILSQHGT